MLDDQSKLKSTDPDQIARLLEIELIQKRAAWKQTADRNRTIRMVSFFFLFVVIVGAVLAYFLIFSNLKENRGTQKPASASDTP